MFAAAACCPQTPLLVPELATGSKPEVAELRAACASALDALFAAGLDRLVVLGSADGGDGLRATRHEGSFLGFGRDVRVRLTDTPEEPGALPMPVPMLVAARLLADRPEAPPRVGRLVGPATAPERCVEFGAALVAGESRVGLLVMGDGCTYEGLGGPMRADDTPAAAFDAATARALTSADPAALLALDPAGADEPPVTGLGPWRVLAGAAMAAGRPLKGVLHYADHPYRVGYAVASWV